MGKMKRLLTPLLAFRSKKIAKRSIVFDRKMRKYCVSCPNFRKPLCPPTFPYQEAIVMQYTHFRLVYVKFDFKRYKEKRAQEFPNWSEKQLGNSRHWQATLKSLLKRFLANFSYKYLLACGSGLLGHGSMEAGGINVFETCENNDIHLEGKYLNPINRYLHFVTLIMS